MDDRLINRRSAHAVRRLRVRVPGSPIRAVGGDETAGHPLHVPDRAEFTPILRDLDHPADEPSTAGVCRGCVSPICA